MILTESTIKHLLGTLTYIRADDYYRTGRVGNLKIVDTPEGVRITANVRGTFEYHSSAKLEEDCLTLECSCPAYFTYGRCKHTGALLIKYVKQKRAQESASASARAVTRQSANAAQLLEQYASDSSARPSLVPSLHLVYNNFYATFTIGEERQYVVKDLTNLANAFRFRQTLAYGTKYTLTHNPADLDPRSRRLLKLISAYAREKTHFRYDSSALSPRDLPLSGWTLDEFFDIYRGESLNYHDSSKTMRFVDEDPPLSLSVDEQKGYVRLSLDNPLMRFEGARYEYVLLAQSIYRLSEKYVESAGPLIDQASKGDLVFSPQGATEFCQNVLPRIHDLMPLNGENALTTYLPSEVDVRYYVDLPERGRMTAQPFFAYGDTIVEADDPLSLHPDIRRNGAQERAAIQALIAFFDPPSGKGKLYELTDEERMYNFIDQGVEKLSENGEVFISDRLKNMHLKKPSHMSIGVSVGDSVLNLRLDSGEFPLDELENLRAAMREKRKYYRLNDGRFLDTDSSELSAFAEVVDGLDLSAKDLKKDTVEVPMSRALYLDGALKQDGNMTFTRDAEFRRLVRDFRTVEDSDFTVPEPLDGVLRNYQKTGYCWLRTLDAYRFGGILSDDMGLGKTLQVLAYLLSISRERDRRGQSGPRASLIVCPASLVLNWGEEAGKWTPELKVCLLTANAAARELEIMRREDYDLLITSYDLLKRDIDAHRQANYYACVLDEAQAIKNHETKGSKAVKEVRAMVRIALTGTPVENRLSELWNIFDFLMPGYLYKYSSFRSRLENPIAKNADKKAQETLRRLVSPFILRRMKKDVLSELPPKVETVQYVQMDEAQRKTYLSYAWDVKKSLESATEKDKIRVLAMLTRLRQLCCDPSLCLENYTGGSCKLDECARMLEELTINGHSVLVFSQFTSMLDRIRDRLDDRGIDSFTLQGDTPRETRAQLVTAFNRGEAPVFLISLKAGGTGLNLTAADTVIHFDPWWNIASQNQATDRCYRIGQSRKVQVYRLIAKDTIEENILKLQSSKQQLVESIVDTAEGSLMSMSKDDLIRLIDNK